MKQLLTVGEPVRILSGVYAGIEGVVEDLVPMCSAVRVYTKDGPVYAYTEDLRRLAPTKG